MNTTIHLKNRTATMTEYFLTTKEELPVIVICPGGAYSWRCERESVPVAEAFNNAGFHAVVVNYDLPPAELFDEPLKDLAAAITYLRIHARALHIDENKIIVCGFSAGGHLAASLGVFWNDSTRFPEQQTRLLQQPNGMILCYPVITAGEFAHRDSLSRLSHDILIQQDYSLETKVTKDVPPCFLWHTMSDDCVPVQNTLSFATALLEHKVSCEVLLFPRGGHGMSLATKAVEDEEHAGTADPHVARWFDQCVDWLNKIIECN